MAYRIILNTITNCPIDIPSFLAKHMPMTSIPSIAPPYLIVNPLPNPDKSPPKTVARNISPLMAFKTTWSIKNTLLNKADHTVYDMIAIIE